MKTSSEFPSVYRVRTRKDSLGILWWDLERLHLGVFCYSWRKVDCWLEEPTKEQAADAIEEDRKVRLRMERHAAFKTHYITPQPSE